MTDSIDCTDVIEIVSHSEPPAQIDPCIAAEVVDIIEADQIEQRVKREQLAISEPVSDNEEPQSVGHLILLQFNRCHKALRDALSEGLPLKGCREELEQHGFNFRLPCGNMVFVHPDQHHAARMAHLPEQKMKQQCFYIIVAADLEYLVDETLDGLGKGAWGKIREPLQSEDASVCATIATHDSDGKLGTTEAHDIPLEISRTFLEFYLRAFRDPKSVVQSTTEAHGAGLNPRRKHLP